MNMNNTINLVRETVLFTHIDAYIHIYYIYPLGYFVIVSPWVIWQSQYLDILGTSLIEHKLTCYSFSP